MKKLLYSFSLLLSLTILIPAQSFDNSLIYLKVTNAGSTLFGAPSKQNLQIVRMSPLISGNNGEVFDYLNDADWVDTTAHNVESLTVSDFQIKSVFNNSYSNEPPAYRVELNAYGWNNQAYAISHYKVINNDSVSYQSKFGFEVLPFIENIYGNEVVEYDAEDDYIRIMRDTAQTFVGLKILNSPLVSMNIIEWDTAYNRSDSLLYANLFGDSVTTSYQAGELGSVMFPAIASQGVNSGESYEVYTALAAALNETALDSIMQLAVDKYNELLLSNVEDEVLPKQIVLEQNYPNPFNPTTTIQFSLPQIQKVDLSVYNILGQKIATLLDEIKIAGNHKIKFDASRFASGVYFYRLQTQNFAITKKMLLVK